MSEPETTGERRFVWPSAYYSEPSPKSRFPGWALYGCGSGAILILVVVFVGGSWLASGGFFQFMDFAVGMSVAEMKGMYAADVPAARKESLDREIETLRGNLRDERVTLLHLKPFLEALNQAISDQKVTSSEASSLERTARHVNARVRRR